MKTLLVTGGAGFIGSNFVSYLLDKYYDYRIVNLDLLTYAGNLINLSEIEKSERYHFVQGDICNRQLIEYLFETFNIQGVFHFAAESHVDNSIASPEIFLKTNIMGTYILIDVARKYWMTDPFTVKEGYEHCRFIHVSTDEVYGSLPKDGSFTENTPYAPNSPYSASKAGSDLIVRSYFQTYGLNVITTNCSNNYGPKQHSEKLIPTIIEKALSLNPIPIFGDGENIRDWLYVLDHCKALDLVFHNGRSGETYNIGGSDEHCNNYVVKKVCEILDSFRPIKNNHLKNYSELITYVRDRPGHDKRYSIDASKIKRELGWKASEKFESGIVKTVEWYLKYGNYKR